MRKIVWLVISGLLFSGMGPVSAEPINSGQSHPEDSNSEQQAETPLAHLKKAKALLHAGDYEAATTEYRQALKLDPKLQEARQTLARIEAGAALREKNFSAAEEAKKRGEHRLAVRFYTKLLESDALAGARYPLFVTYYNRGNSYLAQRDAIAAIKDYDKAIELNPEYVSSYYNRGSAYSMLGKLESGIADYSKVIELQPEHVAAYFNRANAYVARREYSLATADYEKALELKPGWEKAQKSLLEARAFQQTYGRFKQGIAAEKRGDYDAAASIYSEVLDSGRLDSKNAATIYYARARIHKRKNDYPATISDLKRAVELNPKWLALQKTLQAVEAEAADIEQRLGRAALVPPKEEEPEE